MINYLKFRIGLFLVKLRVYFSFEYQKKIKDKEKRKWILHRECLRYVLEYKNMRLLFPELAKTDFEFLQDTPLSRLHFFERLDTNLHIVQKIDTNYILKFVPFPEGIYKDFKLTEMDRPGIETQGYADGTGRVGIYKGKATAKNKLATNNGLKKVEFVESWEK